MDLRRLEELAHLDCDDDERRALAGRLERMLALAAVLLEEPDADAAAARTPEDVAPRGDVVAPLFPADPPRTDPDGLVTAPPLRRGDDRDG